MFLDTLYRCVTVLMAVGTMCAGAVMVAITGKIIGQLYPTKKLPEEAPCS